MKERTRGLYPLRRLIELRGSIPEAAEAIAVSKETLYEGLRDGAVSTVIVLAAECILRRQGPTETQRAIIKAIIEDVCHEEFHTLSRPFGVRTLHVCPNCLIVAAPWRNVGAIQELAKHLGGNAERIEE
jgi:hypothetical protein